MLLYDRLKRGRIERDLKNSVNSRDIIHKELLIELNKPGPDLSDAIKTVRPMKFKSPKKSVHDGFMNQSRSDHKKTQNKLNNTMGNKNNQTIKKEGKNFGSSQDGKDQMMTSSIPENKQNKSTGDDSADNFNNERSKKKT